MGGSRVKEGRRIGGEHGIPLFLSFGLTSQKANQHLTVTNFEDCGAPGMIRTCDLWFRRPTLYPTELRVQERSEDSLRFQTISFKFQVPSFKFGLFA